MTFFDAHCHLQDERLAPCLDVVLRRASEAGVTRMICCGTREEDWPLVLELCGRHGSLLPSFGLHPWYLRDASAGWLEKLRDLLKKVPSAGVGETGLDHGIKERNDEQQQKAFLAQLQLATELKRPVSVHCRRAWETLLDCLRQTDKADLRFVIHSYSGSAALIEPLAELGAYFSFSGSVTLHRNKRSHEACAAVPRDRLLIETDTPDLTPILDQAQSRCPQLNEPANLVHIARKAAELRNMTIAQLAELTTANARQLFGIQ